MDRAIRPLAERVRMKFVTDHLTHLRALAALGHGRDEEAYTALAGLTPPGVLPPGLPWFHLPFFDFVDAALRTGRTAQARAHVAAGDAARMGDISPHHAFLLAAARALAAADEEADALYEAAYAVPGADGWVFELARLRLAHGTWLRDHRRPRAPKVLRQALETFRALGAAPGPSGPNARCGPPPPGRAAAVASRSRRRSCASPSSRRTGSPTRRSASG
ncbi:hypothetical protein ACFQ3Z_42520 [Streptomyces nogalater]